MGKKKRKSESHEMKDYRNEAFENDHSHMTKVGQKGAAQMNKKKQGAIDSAQTTMAVTDLSEIDQDIKHSTSSSPSRKSAPSKTSDKSKAAASRSARPPTTSVLRSAMYYQNRIIIQSQPETKSKSPSSTHASPSPSSAQSPAGVSPDSARQGQGHRTRMSGAAAIEDSTNDSKAEASRRHSHSDADSRRRLEAGASSVTMDARGIDIVVTDPDNQSRRHSVKKKNTIWRRFFKVLQDNRMKGKPDAERILSGGNPEEYRILKKVLNIIFLTVGIALLIAVVIVIIYNAVVLKAFSDPSQTNTTLAEDT